MFKLKQSKKDSLWYWSLPAANGEIVCQSEGYATKYMALKGMASVVINAAKLSLKRALGMAWYNEVEDDYTEPVVEEAPFVEQAPVEKKVRKKKKTA